MLYEVTIAASGLGGSAPADGFIDPSTGENYYTRSAYTGTATSPTVVSGNSFLINGVTITVAGTDLTAVVTAINAKTNYHHVKASVNSNKLQLIMMPGFDHLIPSITDITPNITATLGFVVPTKGSTSLPSSKANSVKKVRANIRWQLVLEALQRTSNISVLVTDVPAGTQDVDPTSVKFNLVVSNEYFNIDLNGDIVYGENAIKQAIASALMVSATRLMTFYDPTDVDPGDGTKAFGTASEKITAGALTTDEGDAIAATTVTAK